MLRPPRRDNNQPCTAATRVKAMKKKSTVPKDLAPTDLAAARQPVSPLAATPSPSVDTAFAQSEMGQKLRAILVEGRGTNALIAEFFLRNPVRATTCGIEELSAQAQTSTATVSRFARTLGFEGFAAMRSAMAETLQTALQPVFQPVDKLRNALRRKGETGSSSQPIISESLHASLANIQSVASNLNPTMLIAIAHKLLAADTVYTLGFGMSAHLSAMLALDLQPFCRQSINVVEFGGTEVAAGRLMNIGPKDLLISISFPRYASDAVMLTRYARDRKAHVIALTDSMASPLAHWSNDVLVAPATHPVLSSSYSAALVAIETLVTCLMVSGDNQVNQAQKLTDAISAYLYTDKPGNTRNSPSAAKRAAREQE
jgi:DNA-binding MurR/RpiR family transcriptional regulator